MFKKLNYFLCFSQLLVTEILNTLASKVANSHTLFSLTLFIFYLDNLILHHYILLKWNSLKLEFQLSSFCFLNFSFLLHWQGGKFANKFSTAILIFTFGGMYFTALPGPHTYSIDGFQQKIFTLFGNNSLKPTDWTKSHKIRRKKPINPLEMNFVYAPWMKHYFFVNALHDKVPLWLLKDVTRVFKVGSAKMAKV